MQQMEPERRKGERDRKRRRRATGARTDKKGSN
jgi:hypothetical protein